MKSERMSQDAYKNTKTIKVYVTVHLTFDK